MMLVMINNKVKYVMFYFRNDYFIRLKRNQCRDKSA